MNTYLLSQNIILVLCATIDKAIAKNKLQKTGYRY